MFNVYALYPVLLWPFGPFILVWALLAFNRILNTRQKWPRVNGMVQEVQLGSHAARGVGRMYLPKIIVSYQVDGRSYRATFQWDAGINSEYARHLLSDFQAQGLTSLQYAPYDPAIVRLRSGKLSNETWIKYLAVGSLGLLLSILTLLSIGANLLISAPIRTIILTATTAAP